VLPKHKGKLKKEDPSQSNEKEQNETSEKYNKFMLKKPSILDNTFNLIAALSRYFTKIKIWFSRDSSHDVSKIHYTKVDNILQFKQTQNYYD